MTSTKPVDIRPSGALRPAYRLAVLVIVGAETNDEQNHRLAFVELSGLIVDPERSHHQRLQHFAFEYETLDELLGTYARLKAEGILPVLCTDAGAQTAFYYEDPDHNSVELNVDTRPGSRVCVRNPSPSTADSVNRSTHVAQRAIGLPTIATARWSHLGELGANTGTGRTFGPVAK
jgi:catechol-2,3-dioxygenase